MTEQHEPDCCGAYGSSRLSTWKETANVSAAQIRIHELRCAGAARMSRKYKELTEPQIDGTM